MRQIRTLGRISADAVKLAAALALAPLLLGCIETVGSDQVSDDAIYRTYRVTYSEESGRVLASASFNVGGPLGTSIRLQSPSRILLNDLQLSERSFLGTTYEGDWAVPFSAEPYRWTWIDRRGDAHFERLSIVPFEVQSPPASVSPGASLTITMTGQSLSSEDSWGAWITQDHADGSTRTESLEARVLDGRRLRLDASQETRLEEGDAQLVIRRTRSAGLQQGPSRSGTVYATFEATPIRLRITR